MSESKVAKSSIYEKIENKGAVDAKEISRIGQVRAEALKESIINAANDEASKLLAKSFEKNQDRIKTKTTEIEQIAKQKTLFKKKEIIDLIFEETHQKLLNISDDELFKLVLKLIKAENLVGDEVIKVSKVDYPRYLKLFSSQKAADEVVLDKLNVNNYQLKLSNQPVDINGGFIIVGTNFDIDLSYKSILQVIKENNETVIANMLFNEGE